MLVYQVSRFPLEAQSLGWKQYIGAGLFALGMAFEFGSEETRRQFKAKPENKGKIDNTGLFGVVRHPNYAGTCEIAQPGTACSWRWLPQDMHFGALESLSLLAM